jgi:hypothetical protein
MATKQTTSTLEGAKVSADVTAAGSGCACTNMSCERHGNCDACKAYHHARNTLTTCERNR